MLVDGKVTNESRVTFTGAKGNQFIAVEDDGSVTYVNSPKQAASIAWQKPRDYFLELAE